MTAHDTPDRGPNQTMVLDDVTGHSANRSAFEAAFRVGLDRNRGERQ